MDTDVSGTALVQITYPDFAQLDIDSIKNKPEDEWEAELVNLIKSSKCPMKTEKVEVPITVTDKERCIEYDAAVKNLMADSLIDMINSVEE